MAGKEYTPYLKVPSSLQLPAESNLFWMMVLWKPEGWEADGGHSSDQGLLTLAAKRLTLEPYMQAMLASHVNCS